MTRLMLWLLYTTLAVLARRDAYDLVYSKQLPKLRPRCWEMVLSDQRTAGRPCIRKPLHHGEHHAEPLSLRGLLFEELVEDLREKYIAQVDEEHYELAEEVLAEMEGRASE